MVLRGTAVRCEGGCGRTRNDTLLCGAVEVA